MHRCYDAQYEMDTSKCADNSGPQLKLSAASSNRTYYIATLVKKKRWSDKSYFIGTTVGTTSLDGIEEIEFNQISAFSNDPNNNALTVFDVSISSAQVRGIVDELAEAPLDRIEGIERDRMAEM